MIKILSSKQIKEVDAYTIQHEPVASIDLMERACRAFVGWFVEHFDAQKKVGIVCGTGNNGGDGLGIARMLKDWGYPVKVWIVRGLVPESADFKINLSRLEGNMDTQDIVTLSDNKLFDDRDVLIDAIFGTGLSRAPEGIYAQTIAGMNDCSAVRVSVDMPSGLQADQPSTGAIVKADFTLSFQLPKLVFLLPQYNPFVGQWKMVDIGLHKDGICQQATTHFYLTLNIVKKIIKQRSRFDHKGMFGHALLIAGSYGKMGAAVLAARASLRGGVGLLTVHVPKTGYDIMQTTVPEAMADVDEHAFCFTAVTEPEKYDAIGIGPGLGTEMYTVKALATVLEKSKKPVVIDADALNMLSVNREQLHLIPSGSILTPHPKEFERLVGSWKTDFEKLDKQKQLAVQLQSVIVVKGANTTIASPEGKIYFNSTGNPGMATGGSGDVLTGILTALLAQAYESVQAAILGVYLHGLAGDLAVREMGTESLTASDLVDFLPRAFLQLQKRDL